MRAARAAARAERNLQTTHSQQGSNPPSRPGLEVALEQERDGNQCDGEV